MSVGVNKGWFISRFEYEQVLIGRFEYKQARNNRLELTQVWTGMLSTAVWFVKLEFCQALIGITITKKKTKTKNPH